MKRIIVTGASGFIGRAVVEACSAYPDDLEIFCLYKGQQPSLEGRKFTWIECDLEDIASHQALMNKLAPTHCIHLAWHVPPHEFWHSPKNVDWLYISVKLFEAFSDAGGKCFLGAGSIGEYDMSVERLDELLTPLTPSNLYGQTKRSLYLLLEQIQKKKFPEVVLLWARIGYFFGEFQPREKLFTRLLESLEMGTPLKIMSGDTRRPYAHVKYLGEALVRALLCMNRDTIFNVGASRSYSLQEIVEIFAQNLGKNSAPIIYGGYRPPVPELAGFKISTKIFEDAVGWSIPDTFVDDVATFAHTMRCKQLQK